MERKMPPVIIVAFLMFACPAVGILVSTSEEFLGAVESASSGDAIEVQAGRYLDVCGIEFRKSLSITGLGDVELDCSGKDSHFKIVGSGVNVELSNLAFVNGHSEGEGGCVRVSNGADVKIATCSFAGCAATEHGGALSVGDSTNVRISDSTFKTCTAAQGGAVGFRGSGVSATVEKCHFINNSAVEGGAILLESALLEITGKTLFGGNIAERGGGIAAKIMPNSTHGSAISIGSGTIFQENFAVSTAAQGAAIHAVDGTSLTTFGEVFFVDNEAHSDTSAGGAVFVSGASTAVFVGQTVMRKNFATAGSAVWAGGASHVELREGAVVSHNTALLYGALYGEGVGTLLHVEDNVLIEYNTGRAGAGVMVISGVHINLFNNISILNNLATARTGAGVFLFHINSLETRGRVRFHDNTAFDEAGGLYLHTSNTANLTAGVSVKGNRCGRNGCGVGVLQHSVLYADETEITDNEGGADPSVEEVHGGGLRCQECTLHLTNCYFARNRADVGGAMYWKGGGTCINTRFEHNVADAGGAIAHFTETPTQVNRNAFFNNSAAIEGGAILSAETSVIHLSNSTFDQCTARKNGASLLLKDHGTILVSGVVTMQGGHAGGTGGAVHHQGKLLHVQPGASLLLRSNAAHGGGGMSSTSTVRVDGYLGVLDNIARGGNGGGVQGFGMLSAMMVSEEGWLEVADNEAAAANGGGVALMDNARLAFDLESGCPSTCQGLGDGVCHPDCMRHQCRWDEGDCDANFFQAGGQSTQACPRTGDDSLRCPLWALEDSSATCIAGCLSSKCDWGYGSVPCAPAVEAIGECPYLTALIYSSHAGADVRYVKEGGTARGYGRCESNTCSSADATSGRDEPYCTTVNDGGRVIELDCDECITTHETGEELWGPCAEPNKPRLPHVGFDYDPAELQAVLQMDIPSLFRKYPGCGYHPMAIRRNRAAHAGGGVYKDDCDALLEATDRCFVGELDNQRLPSVAIDLADNHAGGPGGGIFVECGEMSACLRTLQAAPGLPGSVNATDRLLYFGDDSAADAYGKQAAGLPVELQLTGPAGNATPGQALIDVQYQLLDVQGQSVRGSEAWPNPHLVEVSVCRVGQACTARQALQAFLLRSHPTDAATSTLLGEAVLPLCPAGDRRVEVHVQVTGTTAPGLHKSVIIGCQPCGAGQEMVLNGEGDAMLWSCRSCQPSEYVVSPEGGCQPCPLEGAECDGTSLSSTVAGAGWAAEDAVMRLQSCPAGYILVRDPELPVLDTCVLCPPGKFSIKAATYPDMLTAARASDAPLMCFECVRGAECLGGEDIIAQPGFWEDRAARDTRRTATADHLKFYQCSPGACEGNNSCSDGRHGPVCGLCKEEWGRSGLECVQCGSDSAIGKPSYLPSFIITVLCGFIFLYLLTWRPLLEDYERAIMTKLCWSTIDKDDNEGDDNTASSRLGTAWRHVSNIRWTSPAMIGAFKVAVSFYQVTSTFNITFRIDWPDSFRLMSSLGRLTGLDLSLLLPSMACVSREYDHIQSLAVFTTAFPLLMTLVLCLPFLLTRLLGVLHFGGSTAHPKHDAVQRSCLRAVLLWFFLIYPTVSEHTLATFFCEDLGSGGHVLVMDKSMHCPWGGASPTGGFYFALFLVVLFPIGIPAFFYYIVSAFFVPAMAESKYSHALFAELIKLYRTETSTPVSVKLAQHIGMASGSNADKPPSPPSSPISRRSVGRASSRLNSEASESAVPLQSFKRRVSQLFTQTFVQRELSGVGPASSLHDKLTHVLERFGCSGAELARMVTVLQRLSISDTVGEGLDAFEQLALKIAHNHFLFTGHETLEELSMEQLKALFLFDWEGLNRKRSEREIRKRKVRRQRMMQTMDSDKLRRWVFAKAQELEKAARISVPTVNWNGETPEEERALRFVGFLFDDFRVQTWWFFLFGEFCKLIMTSVLVFIPGRFWQQLAWGFFVQVCIIALYVTYKPMAEPWLNQFQVYALSLQSAILFFGLLLSVADQQDPAQQSALDKWAILLLFLKCTLVFYPLAVALLSRIVHASQLALKRIVHGDTDDTEEREPTCLERTLFPTAANQQRRRLSSTQSFDQGLHLTHSVSDADLLGVDPSPVSPLCYSPTTNRRSLRPSSVDAQLVTPRLHNVQHELQLPPPSDPATEIEIEGVRRSASNSSGPADDAVVDAEPTDGPRPQPEASTLELSVTPTPRK